MGGLAYFIQLGGQMAEKLNPNPRTMITLFSYGGIHAPTHQCMMRDLCVASKVLGIRDVVNALEQEGKITLDEHHKYKQTANGAWDVGVYLPPEDALIERSRSRLVETFLKETDAEILVMIDHDLDWVGPSANYEGDLLHIARQAAATKGIVGAVVSKKTFSDGVACMWKETGTHYIGQDAQKELEEVYCVGAAFTAFHRDVVQAVYDSEEYCEPGFRPVFQTMRVRHPWNEQNILHLSEDWAFCFRARDLGFKTYVALKPFVTHWGKYGYNIKSAQRKDLVPQISEEKKISELTISCLHATRGRPDRALAVWELWKNRSSGKINLEYIFSVDHDDKPSLESDICLCKNAQWDTVIGHSRGNVDAYNRAARHSTGQILIQIHDDLEPPQDWDIILAGKLDWSKPQVLKVDDGNPVNAHKSWLLTVMIGTRKWFEQCGYFMHPDYISVYNDDDMSCKAAVSGVIVDGTEFTFRHHWGGNNADDTYRHNYRPAAWELGQELFKRRCADGWPNFRPSIFLQDNE